MTDYERGWAAAIEAAANKLESSTFNTDAAALDTVGNCVALVRALRPPAPRAPGDGYALCVNHQTPRDDCPMCSPTEPDGCTCPNPELHRQLAEGRPIDPTKCAPTETREACPSNPDGQHRPWHDDGAYTHCRCGKEMP
jgi:hypothetical protein